MSRAFIDRRTMVGGPGGSILGSVRRGQRSDAMERVKDSERTVERRGDGHRQSRTPTLESRRAAVDDARAAMTRVFRTRSRGLVAEFGR
jgi:hypothetical protein